MIRPHFLPMARSRSSVKKVKTPPPPANAAPGAALLVVDMQDKLLAMLPPEAGRAVRARAALAVAAARGLGLPVHFSEQVPSKLGPTSPGLRALAPDAPAWAKDTFSAVAHEPLRDALRAEGIEHLLVLGIETPVCVYQTALGALAEGWQVTVLTDAIGGRRPADQEACLAALRGSGVHLLPVETVFYALLHDAGHPFFRTFTELVKTHV